MIRPHALISAMLLAALAFTALAVETPASAATPSGETEGDVYLTREQWRAIADGRTLYYRNESGAFVGREYYVPGTQRAVFVYFDGNCYEGTWSESGGVFEFRYDDVFFFRHLRRGDSLIAAEIGGSEQVVFNITDEVLSCAENLTS